MKRLLQVKIAGTLKQKMYGEITEAQCAAFIDGVNYALNCFNLQYSTEKQEVIDASTAQTIQPPSDIVYLAFFKRGVSLVEETAVETKQELPDTFKSLVQQINEL
ncbi:hypothetical protein [Enterococcus innesii]|uniref:hypothetical protein n=1 Tax=Enterococcus innesii TaxID=2839759 RepID=UPI0034A4DD7D